MKKRLYLFLFILLSGHPAFSADTTSHFLPDELQLLKQNVLKDILSVTVNKDAVIQTAAAMKTDGSWDDIAYADKTRGGWPVADHLNRLLNMAILYTCTKRERGNEPELKDKIIQGLDYWLQNDFICPNWWYPEIGVPKLLGPTMLLMEESLTSDQRQAGLKILSRAKVGMTGQNKVWLSGNVIYRSLLTGEVEPIKVAVKAIQDELVLSDGEGIQADQSFHQHGPQQQFGNYGAAFANDMLKWASIFQNTPFQFDEEKIVILRNYLLNGMRWIIWKNQMDISACGRQLFPQAQVDKVKSLHSIYAKMPMVDSTYRQSYEQALNDFSGNKHFWRSDMTVHRRLNFYASVKMASKRVAGAESCNAENVQGYHLGDGATYFYQTNQEYLDIFPFLDWKMIPGTTAFHDTAPLPVLPCSGYRIESDFVGGVSNGMNGVATLAYNRDKLTAQKSYFFLDDVIICLGAGINTEENKEVRTTVNQSFLHGKVVVKQQGAVQRLQTGKHTLHGVSWIIHDRWGYYFPGKEKVELINRVQTGQWNYLLKRIPPKDIKATIFTLYIKHQVQPKDARYSYFVFPAAEKGTIEGKAALISVVENSESLQVVENMQKEMAGFVFVAPGQVTTRSFRTISSSRPCVLIIDKKGAAMRIAVADPTHTLTSIEIGVEGKKTSLGVPSSYDAQKNTTIFAVSLPQGSEAGSSSSFMVM